MACHHQSHAVQHSENLTYHIGHNDFSSHHLKESTKSAVKNYLFILNTDDNYTNMNDKFWDLKEWHNTRVTICNVAFSMDAATNSQLIKTENVLLDHAVVSVTVLFHLPWY